MVSGIETEASSTDDASGARASRSRSSWDLVSPLILIFTLLAAASSGCRAADADGGSVASAATYDPAWDEAPPRERTFNPSRRGHPSVDPGQRLIGVVVVPDSKNRPLVSSVDRGGPADAAGLKAWDLIVSVDGAPVKAPDEMKAALGRDWLGRKVQIEVERDGERLLLEVTTVKRAG